MERDGAWRETGRGERLTIKRPHKRRKMPRVAELGRIEVKSQQQVCKHLPQTARERLSGNNAAQQSHFVSLGKQREANNNTECERESENQHEHRS